MPKNGGGNRNSATDGNISSDSDVEDSGDARHNENRLPSSRRSKNLGAKPTYNTVNSATEDDVENGRLPGDFSLAAIESTDSGGIGRKQSNNIVSSILSRFGLRKTQFSPDPGGHKRRQTSFRNDGGAAQYRYNLEQNSGMTTAGDADQQQLILSDTIHQAARTGDVIGLRMLLDMFPAPIRKAHISMLDETGSAPLHYAARYNHVEIAKLLLIAGANVNVKSEDGQTPLHFSCRYKSKPPKHSFQQGARADGFNSAAGDSSTVLHNFTPNHSDSDIHTPHQVAPPTMTIHTAVDSHHSHLISNPSNATLASGGVGSTADSLIKIFAATGANVNARDRYGNTPLHIAVMRGNEHAVRELLELPDVRVDIADESKQTPLHIAALSGRSTEILHAIVGRSKDLRATDANSNAPLHLACAQGNLNVVRILLEEARKRFGDDYVRDMLHDKDDENQIPLMLAVEGGHMVIADLLLKKGSSIDFPNDNLDTPLHVAANRGDLEMCQLLIERGGAAVEARNARLQTPLHRAAAMDRLHVAEYLINAGGSLEASDQNAWTPMLIAARHGHVDMVRKLISSGANIYAVSKRDRNALFLAASSNHPQTVSALLESAWGRELLFRNDRYGLFPIHIACKKGHLDVVRVMIHKGACPIDERLEDEKTPLHLAAQYGWHHIVSLLTSENVDLVNYEDENSDTPLHLAALNGHRETVVKLIRLGASVVSRNANMWTPLDCAASRGHTAVCEELLKSEAPIDPRDKTSTTPLHLACMAGYVATAKLLVEYGASVCARDADGKNCLDFAVENGHRAVAMYLIQSPKWRDGLRNDQWVRGNGRNNDRTYRETPMRKLIRFMPDVAYQALNRCIETRGRADDLNFKVVCNYEFIDDTFSHWVGDPPFEDRVSAPPQFLYNSSTLKKGSLPYIEDAVVLKENHPLQVMVRYKQEELLTHPLTTSLIQTKWALFGRYAFFFTFFAYVIFLAFLTAYCMESHPVNRLYYVRTFDNGTTFTYWEPDLCPNGTVWPLSNDVNKLTDTAAVCRTVNTYRQAPYNCTMDFLERESSDNSFLLFFIIGQFVLPVLSVFLLLKEAIQFALLRSAANIVAWPVYIMTIIVTIPWDGFNCYNHYGLMPSWEWQLTSFNIFLAWIQLVLLLRNFPWIGLYVQMLEDVTVTVMGFFPVFFLVSTAFVLGFFISFQGSVRHDQRADFLEEVYDDSWELNPFYSIPISYVKTFTMVVGEYEQESHFQNTNQPVILVLYVIFLLVCTIIIVNLMIGLAVQDIKAVQEHASLKRVAMRIELVLSVERLTPLWLRVLLFRHRRILYPNRSSRREIVGGKNGSSDAATSDAAGAAASGGGGDGRQLHLGGTSGWWARAMATERVLGGTSVSAGEIARAQQRHVPDAAHRKLSSEHVRSNVSSEIFDGDGGTASTSAIVHRVGDEDIEQKLIGAQSSSARSTRTGLMPSMQSSSNLSSAMLLPDADTSNRQSGSDNGQAVVKMHEQILQHVDTKLNAFQNEILSVLNEIRSGKKPTGANRAEPIDVSNEQTGSSSLLQPLLLHAAASGLDAAANGEYESIESAPSPPKKRSISSRAAASPRIPTFTLTTTTSPTTDRERTSLQGRRGSVRFGDGRVRQISSTGKGGGGGGGDGANVFPLTSVPRNESGNTTTSTVSDDDDAERTPKKSAGDVGATDSGSKRQVTFENQLDGSDAKPSEVRRRHFSTKTEEDFEQEGLEMAMNKAEETNKINDSESAAAIVAASVPPIL